MDLRRQDGAISVYLSIIFLIIVALVGTIVDGARIRTGETQVKRAVESAARSSLAGYLKPLKEDYGLFALAENDPEQLQLVVEEYLNGTLMTGLGGDDEELSQVFFGDLLSSIFKDKYKKASFVNLFDYRIEDTSVIPCYNLTENEVMRNQIVEFMKYRAPKQIATEMANRTGMFGLAQEMKKAGNSSKALSKKMELDDLLGMLGNRQIELADCVNTVKLFPDNKLGEYNGKSRNEGKLLQKYGKLNDEYIEAAEAYFEKDDKGSAAMLKNAVHSKFRELERSLTICKAKNELCVETAESIAQLKQEIKSKLSEYDLFVRNEKDNLDADFIHTLEEELELARKAISRDNSEKVKEKADRNVNLIGSVLPKLRELNNGIDSYGAEVFKNSWNKASLPLGVNGIGQYDRSLKYHYLSLAEWKAEKGKKSSERTDKKDTRNQLDAARKEVENAGSGKEYLKEIDEDYYKERPSLRENGGFPNKRTSDVPIVNGEVSEAPNEEDSLQGFTGNDMSFGKSDTFNDEDIKDVKASLNSMTGIGDKLSEFLFSSRDELYINEYVMGMFTNDVPVIRKNSGGTLKTVADTSKDLRHREKASERKAYLKYGEVEYVLFGMKGEKDNIRAVSLGIGGIRFGINLAALHKMPKKMKEATIIAEAIAAAIAVATAGSGAAASAASINAIREAVLAGWASLEAYQDVKYLKQGRMIPVWKDESTWITDEDGGIKAIDRGDSSTALLTSYHDYLRLFLAMKSFAAKEGKLNNIEDIIQYNIRSGGKPDFKLADYNTFIQLDTGISMRYFFMTFAFMPKRLKTEDGRHKFSTVLMHGY